MQIVIRKNEPHYLMERNIEASFNKEEDIYIKDVESLKKKLKKMKEDGIANLGVFADFDYTLTKQYHEGGKADNSFGTLENVNQDYPISLSQTSSEKNLLESVHKLGPNMGQ
jgi:hypothetical protein